MHGSILVHAFFHDHFMLLFGLRMSIYRVLYTSHIAADIRDHELEAVPGISISNQIFLKVKEKKTVLEWNCLNFLCIDAQLPWKMPTIILEYTTCPCISLYYFLTTFSFGTYVFSIDNKTGIEFQWSCLVVTVKRLSYQKILKITGFKILFTSDFLNANKLIE